MEGPKPQDPWGQQQPQNQQQSKPQQPAGGAPKQDDAGADSGVYVFGPKYPKGTGFRNMGQMISVLRYAGLLPQRQARPEDTVPYTQRERQQPRTEAEEPQHLDNPQEPKQPQQPKQQQVPQVPKAPQDQNPQEEPKRTPMPDQVPDAIDQLLRKRYAIIHKKGPADIVVYAQRLPIVTSAEVADEVAARLNLHNQDVVVHRTNSKDGTGKTVPVENVLYGQKEKEQAEQGQEQQTPSNDAFKALQGLGKSDEEAYTGVKAAMAALGDKATSADLVNFALSGKPQPKTQTAQPVQQPQSVQQPAPQPTAPKAKPKPEPFPTLGFTYDQGFRGNGVYVGEIIDGGPLALAGVQAGDVIDKIEYEDKQGKTGDYDIDTVEHLKNALMSADPKSPMIVRVRRMTSPQPLFFPLYPTPPKQTAQQPAPKAKDLIQNQGFQSNWEPGID